MNSAPSHSINLSWTHLYLSSPTEYFTFKTIIRLRQTYGYAKVECTQAAAMDGYVDLASAESSTKLPPKILLERKYTPFENGQKERKCKIKIKEEIARRKSPVGERHSARHKKL